jgi:hypothetical protein
LSLPKIAHAKFQTVLPSTGKAVSFRPFTGREQKIMLVAKESGATADVIRSLVDVIGSCVDDLDVRHLPLFDLEYLFLAVRAKSVGNKIEVKVTEDGKQYDAVIDLDAAKVELPKEKPSDIVSVGENVSIKLRYPTAASVSKMIGDADQWDMLAASVAAIIDGENVIAADDVTHDELKEWIMQIPLNSLDGVKKFFEGRPTLKIKAEFVRADKSKGSIELAGIGDFFE